MIQHPPLHRSVTIISSFELSFLSYLPYAVLTIAIVPNIPIYKIAAILYYLAMFQGEYLTRSSIFTKPFCILTVLSGCVMATATSPSVFSQHITRCNNRIFNNYTTIATKNIDLRYVNCLHLMIALYILLFNTLNISELIWEPVSVKVKN